MSEQKYQYSTTNTSVKYNERSIKGSLTFGVGGPIAAAKVGELFEEVNELERQLAALTQERDVLRSALIKIGSRGVVSDAKGTWSKEVFEIAQAALHSEQKS